MSNVRIIFVLQKKYADKHETSEIMQQAYQLCVQNDTNVTWAKESSLKSLTLNKTDVVVFEKFEGEVFEDLKCSKCARFVGPWAVSVCLIEGKPIPNFDWPIYNVAMYNCVITCSDFTKDIKMDVKSKVELMGGYYEDNLLKSTTHLITGSAKSEKYLVAAESGVKVMCLSWVNDVWETSQNTNVHANNEQFLKHKCLPFHNLTICSTGLRNKDEKDMLEKLITENGGSFTNKLVIQQTNILICSGEVNNSAKYKGARQTNHIKCVNINWIMDSIDRGYALRENSYQIQKITSTPTKEDKFVNPEFSIISAIGSNTSQQFSIEDSLSVTKWNEEEKAGTSKRKAKNTYEELIDSLNTKKAKQAGHYLDGCSVYLVGFNSEHTEKLNKIINMSGATRYDVFSERVTHVVVGDSNNYETTIIRSKNTSAVLVSVNWVIDSMEQQCPVAEHKYLISSSNVENENFGSPLSKKGLSLLRSSKTVTEKEIELSGINKYEDAMDHDITSNQNESDTLARLLEGVDNATGYQKRLRDTCTGIQTTGESTTSITQDVETEVSRIFENMKFLVVEFDEEDFDILKESIIELGGDIVSKTYKGIPDYAVVPIFIKNELHYTASEVVNNLYIGECKRQGEYILPNAYYYRPFNLPETRPLENCVITISTYTGAERIFLNKLIEALGGIPQDQLCRVQKESKSVLANTHLIIPEATGKKYEAAVKWGLPVVTKDWLLDCAKTGKRVYEGDFLLGDSKAPEKECDLIENTPQKKSTLVLQNNPVSVDTPTTSKVLTPVNQATPYHKRFLNSAEKFSQVTPVNKIMKQFREGNLSSTYTKDTTDKEYSVPPPWAFLKTPETPLGKVITPNPTTSLNKQLAYWLQQFPDKPSPQSNNSTPLSEIKRKLWKKACEGYKDFEAHKLNFDEEISETCESQTTTEDVTPENIQLASKFEELENMLSASGGGRRQSRNFQSTIPAPAGTSEFKDSQPCTVDWDFRSQQELELRPKTFALSGIADESEKNMLCNKIEQLGGTVSVLANYDSTCTHLLCPKPARNEKTLSSMAAGKWILHLSYVEESFQAGRFLNEEEYEFGNPKSEGKIPVSHQKDVELRMKQMHWWRKEVARRGYGAFNDMRAIVVATKREPIITVIEAGGGVVIDMKPPFEDAVHATHCLLEAKSVEKFEDYIPLATQGIYLLNTVYISDYLHQPSKDIRDCILPFFTKFYGRH